MIKTYNNYLNYHINERRVSYKRELCPKFWVDFKLIERIKNKLMNIAKDFYDDLETDADLMDVYFTGSLANFNWSSYSDIDIHLIINFSDINEDIDLVEKAFDGQRYIWNLRHNIVIQGHDVEIFVQNSESKHASTGVYSIMHDKWIKKPEYNPPVIDQKDVDEKYKIRANDIDRFVELSYEDLSPEESETYYQAARKLKKRISNARKEGLNIIGEFSLDNLVFKKLRRTGKFGKLIDCTSRFYDKIYSQ